MRFTTKDAKSTKEENVNCAQSAKKHCFVTFVRFVVSTCCSGGVPLHANVATGPVADRRGLLLGLIP